VSEIDSLKSTIDALGQSVSLWNKLMIWSFSVAALFTVLGVAATKMVVFKTEEQSGKQDLMNAAKDRQLALDLRDKDVQIEGARRLAADANKATEDERMSRVELEEKVAWRSLGEHQKNAMTSALEKFSGQLAEGGFLSSDTEAFAFSAEIATVLRASQWRVIPPNPYVMMMKETSLPNTDSPVERIDFGVEVTSTSDPQSDAAAHAVAHELGKLGFDAYFKPTTLRPQSSRIWITVQHRPLGPQGEAKLRPKKAKTQ
jgi:hypothetical protein